MTERNPILQSLFERKSVRVYEEKPIPAEMKQAILEAAAQAPSAGCQQLYTILDITDPALTVRRITINANKVTPDEGIYQVDFFFVTKKLEKEKKLQQNMLGIKSKYGKNAVLKASSYEEGATMRQRNAQIGGHSAGGSAGGSDGKLQK